MAKEIKIEKGHVYYYEPNDPYSVKDQEGNDLSLLPEFEDLSIGMTLTAEIPPRDKGDVAVQRSLSFVTYIDSQTSKEVPTNHQIINDGVEMGGEKYLTTYYTEIGGDSYIENDMVEGLGVTSVNISFESWYVPTVTINFVDVHGSALWGREEAIHRDGKITSDNILGVFFTQPYPLFRLQIKGFLGGDVTYQLTVSSFKGSYNSSTGNFEATATFIGYSYSLLTDIPLRVLAVAPEMSYRGKEYWDAHVNDPSWQLLNSDNTTRPPIKLNKLIDDISSAIASLDSKEEEDCEDNLTGVSGNDGSKKDPSSENRFVSVSSASTVTNSTNASQTIGNVQTSLNDFISQCKQFCDVERGGNSFIGVFNKGGNSVEEQLVMIFSSPTKDGLVLPNSELKKRYKVLVDEIDKFNKTVSNNKIVNPIESFENFHKSAISSNEQFGLHGVKVFKKYKSNETPFNSSSKFKVAIEGNKPLTNVRIHGQRLFNDSIIKIDNLIKGYEKTPYISKPIDEYVYVIPLGDLRLQIEKIFKDITISSVSIENKIENLVSSQSNSTEIIGEYNGEVLEETRKKKIVDIIGFEPTIGNFVKILMCHLETFVEVMMFSGDRIADDLKFRTPSNFGIPSFENTDMVSGVNSVRGTNGEGERGIWAWPALYNRGFKENSETHIAGNGQYEVLGWTNDYPANGPVSWEETKVVLSCLNALAKVNNVTEEMLPNNGVQIDKVPLTCGDLISHISPFSNVSDTFTDLEHFVPYLGLRMANIIGLGDNKCTSEMAEHIGYVDALNIISSTKDLSWVEGAIKSVDSNQDFISQSIDYLTCSNKIKSNSETSNGVKYNLFETLKPNSGNVYSSTRHPMYKLDGESYKYTYLYTNPLNGVKRVSLIPTSLERFNGINNPYSNTFQTEIVNGERVFKPAIMNKIGLNNYGGVNQNFVYGGNSANLFGETSLETYTNNHLFFVLKDVDEVNKVIKNIENLRNGNVSFNGVSINGAANDNALKKVLDRKYKISKSEYYNAYNNSKFRRILMPSLSLIDNGYVDKHICDSVSKKYSTTFNKDWMSEQNSSLYRNTIVKFDGSSCFVNGKEISLEQVFVSELPVIGNGSVKSSLFSSELFYEQNNISDNLIRSKAKAYLILTSMMSGIDKIETDVFKNDECSLIKLMKPFYLLFIGAILWRRSQEEEPLQFGTVYSRKPSLDETLISTEHNMLDISSNDIIFRKISDYYLPYDEIDISVRNTLIGLFDEFSVSNDFRILLESLELKNLDGSSLNGLGMNKLMRTWSSPEFNSKSPSSWSELFGNLFDSYSSIVYASNSKTSLRLLFNEKGKFMPILKNLIGLNGGYLVSRGTTERVGLGESEVKLTSGQMRGYLKGVVKRLKSLSKGVSKRINDNTNQYGELSDRDYAVSLYYSLKHLWETWLMTAKRDEFTVDNFFNKSFVFMDSFYMNTYNTIKLNAENILDAYNLEGVNLLRFMEYVTSKEGCMFFALPSFLDSNKIINGKSTVKAYKDASSGDMSWKKEDLQNMFKPMSYNEMGSPQANNTFVFVYTHQLASTASEDRMKRFDSYMINDETNWPNVLKNGILDGYDEPSPEEGLTLRPNNSIPNEDSELITSRYGYLMPCFGVTVNRGNNHIFKSINVSMDSPKVTSVSAQTWNNIMVKNGSDASKKVFFHGQDIYSIYSQYAYNCEIEMMGCAKVQPLMYFQLLNIPMWRGTYMIYKVSHTMQPGNMTTKFTGVKMSRRQSPYATGYFTIPKRTAQSGLVNNKQRSNSLYSSENKQMTNVVGGKRMIQAIFGDNTDWKWPTGAQVFGYERSIGGHRHRGIDLSGVPEGTKLYAPFSGTIVKAVPIPDKDAGGIRLSLRDNNGKVQVNFMHCKELLVKVGQVVTAGMAIALLGHTGRSVANGQNIPNHLHLELYINGDFTKAVDPTIEYGYLGNNETLTNTDVSTNTVTRNNKTSDKYNAIIVGDSWSVGLKPYFMYHVGVSGSSLNKISNEFLPKALTLNSDKIVLSCGLNSIYEPLDKLKAYYIKMGKRAQGKGKKLYVCTFPRLKYPSGYNGMINETNIAKLNKAISDSASEGGYVVISVPNSVSDGSLTNDGFHLTKKGWSKLYNIISQKIK